MCVFIRKSDIYLAYKVTAEHLIGLICSKLITAAGHLP